MNAQKIFAISAIVVLTAAVLIGFVLFGEKNNSSPRELATTQGTIREFEIQALRFGYTPETITVKKGEKVKLVVSNLDALHGIIIPELGIAGNNELEFIAERGGRFTWFCNNFCGDGHLQMQGTLIVEE